MPVAEQSSVTRELIQAAEDLDVLPSPTSQWVLRSPEAAISNHLVNFVPDIVPRETLFLPAAMNLIESKYNQYMIYNIVQYLIRSTFKWTRGKVKRLSKNEQGLRFKYLTPGCQKEPVNLQKSIYIVHIPLGCLRRSNSLVTSQLEKSHKNAS